MEKVLLWGAGDVFQVYSRWLAELEDNKEIEILAIVDKGREGERINAHPVIGKEEIAGYDYDRIILSVVSDRVIESIKQDAKETGIDTKKMITILAYQEDYAMRHEEYYEAIMQNQFGAIKDVLDASDEEVTNKEWMLKTLCKYGIYPLRWDEKVSPYMNAFGVLQIAEEFAEYCNFLATLKVNTAIEIGVAKGRSSYFMCALLYRNNPQLRYTLVDIRDRLDSYERFKELLPALNKQIPSTSKDYKGEAFDFVFIDGDHSYNGSMEDWVNVGKYASKYVCFHDIYTHDYDELDGGIVRSWREVCEMNEDKEKVVFNKADKEPVGIGCIIM